MTPEQLINDGPDSPDDLIGNAAIVARVQSAKATAGNLGGAVKLLLFGEPGCGKSATCKIIANAFENVFVVERISGGQLSADVVRQWIAEARYHSDLMVVRQVEEVDTVSKAAEVLLLQYLDVMPKSHALLCTSNLGMGDLSDRFQSRFQAIKIERPDPRDIADYMTERWPDFGRIALDIAEANSGDVRASLNDLQTHIDKAQYA